MIVLSNYTNTDDAIIIAMNSTIIKCVDNDFNNIITKIY